MWLLLLLSSCDAPPQEEPGPLLVAADGDDDGFTSDVDCDDGDPLVHPAAEERCNGVDDDCSPLTLEASSMAMIPSGGTADVLLCSALMSGNLHLVDANLVIRSWSSTTLVPADDRRPVFHAQGGSLRLQDVTIAGPEGVGYPGESLLRAEGGLLHLRGVEIRGGESNHGAGIHARGGAHVIVESSGFFDNSTIGEGGAVAVEDGTLEVHDTTFQDNFAHERGGAIDAVRSSVSLVDAAFGKNRTDGEGGALYLLGSTLVASRASFDVNHATQGGGAFHAQGSDILAVDSAFVNNGASEHGGAVALVDSLGRFEAVDLDRNYTGPEGLGGAMYAAGSAIEGAWVRLRQNQSLPWGSGGALHLEQASTVRARSWTFLDNVAGARGGAVSVHDAGFEGDGATLMLGNTALEGGAVALSGGLLRTGVLRDNVARRGGAAWMGPGQPPPVLAAEVADNEAIEQGGGLFVIATTGRFDGILHGNVADSGGGAWLEPASGLLGFIDWGHGDRDNAPDDLGTYWTSWSSEAADDWVCDDQGCL